MTIRRFFILNKMLFLAVVVAQLLLLIIQPSLSEYDFIIGFSTGHAGTTSFSSPQLYGSPPDVRFDMEGMRQPHHISTDSWRNSDYNIISRFVEKYIISDMLKRKGDGKTLLDLGHHNLYFVDELLDYILQRTNYTLLIVRITRPRYENAVSLSFYSPKNPMLDMCHLAFRYCPFDRVKDVMLPVTRAVWDNANAFQQALWLLDEVEMRWQRILSRHPTIPRLYLHWTSTSPPMGTLSFGEAAYQLAAYLPGVSPNSMNSDLHLMVHQGENVPLDSLEKQKEFIEEDIIYRENFYSNSTI